MWRVGASKTTLRTFHLSFRPHPPRSSLPMSRYPQTPSSKEAYTFTQPGPITDVLQPTVRPLTLPADDEVLIDVKAVGLNPCDIQIVRLQVFQSSLVFWADLFAVYRPAGGFGTGSSKERSRVSARTTVRRLSSLNLSTDS